MPTGIKIEIEIDGVKQLSRGLEAKGNKAKNLIPFWRDSALPMLRKYQEKVFASGGGYQGLRRWAVRRRWARWRTRLGRRASVREGTIARDKGILVRTGRLRDSFLQSGADAIEVAAPSELRFGTKVPYAIFHQRGYKARDGSKVPARPPLRLSMPMRRRIIRKLEEYLKQ